METVTKPLIQLMKESGEFTGIQENPLKTYYTCVRYSKMEKFDNNDIHPKQPMSQSNAWSCTKGWFEMYGTSFKDKQVDHKVLDYCRFRDTMASLKKDIGEPFVIYID